MVQFEGKHHLPSVFAGMVNLNLIKPVDLIPTLQEIRSKQYHKEAIREI